MDDFAQASASIEHLLAEHRAYLSTAHETRNDGQHRQEMTIKVPPTHFLPLVTALSKLGRINTKDVNSSDITADVLAASTTITTQQAAEARLQQLLAAARSPAEIQRWEAEAERAQTEVAAAQSTLRQLGALRAWATLTLHYSQALPGSEQEVPTPAFLPRFMAAFTSGWMVLLGIVVTITYVWPLLLLAGAGWWAVRRWRLRQRWQA